MEYKKWPDPATLEPPMSDIVPMVQRVEMAALQEIRRTGSEKMEACMVDPRHTECPEDSVVWLVLFAKARRINAELAALLYYLRGGGCRLCGDPKWGARILYEGPWTDEELSVAKAELRKHSADMQYLLAELAWPGGVKPKDDAKTQNQDRHQP